MFFSNRSDIEIEGLRARISRIEKKIDFIYDHLGIELPESEYDKEIRELMGKKKKIEAIKVYRRHTGAGLAEAKEYVERIGIR